jgi:small ligand-binding sensory domain FIST
VSTFAAAVSQHPIPTQAVGEVLGEVLDQLDGDRADLVVTFVSPHHAGALEDIAPAVRRLLEPQVLLGGTVVTVVAGERELEDEPAVSVFAARLPDARLTPTLLRVEQTPDGAAITGWPELAQPPPTLLLFADPFTFPVDALLAGLDQDLPDLQVIGGMASAANRPGGNRLVVDGSVVDAGAVGVFVDGVAVRTVVAQGCRPIGDPFTVTRSERNRIDELGGQTPLARLHQLAANATDEDRQLLQHGLHLGVVVDEHAVDFTRGDFLVRNVMGADQESGALVVGDQVTVGQTVQFHVRDADAADEDLREMLTGVEASAALLFTCNGRGRHLFGVPDHDAALVAKMLGPIPVTGAFCAGEIGPVGGRNFVHGFTASLALF